MPPRNQHVGLIGDCGVQFVFHRHSLRRQLDDIRTRHHWARTGLQLHEYYLAPGKRTPCWVFQCKQGVRT